MNRTPAWAGRRVGMTRLGVAALAIGVGAAGMAAEDEWVSADVFDVLAQGAALSEAGESGKAVALLRRALADLDRPADIAHVSLWLAQKHMAARDWQAARETLRTVVGLAEHLPAGTAERSWNNLATATFQVGDYAEVVRVVADWHGSVADPAAKSWRVLSYAHHRHGDYERALDAGLSYADELRNDGRLVPASFAGSLRFLRYAVEAQGIPAAAGPGAAKALDAANQQIRAGLPLVARQVLSEALASPGLGPTDASLLREKLAWAFQILGNHERVRELLADVVESSDGGPNSPWRCTTGRFCGTAAYRTSLATTGVPRNWRTSGAAECRNRPCLSSTGISRSRRRRTLTSGRAWASNWAASSWRFWRRSARRSLRPSRRSAVRSGRAPRARRSRAEQSCAGSMRTNAWPKLVEIC